MKTICKTDGPETAFIFADVEPEYEEIVRSFYYMPTSEGFAKVFPTDTPCLAQIYANFARHAEEIVLQAARLRPFDWQKAMLRFLDLVQGEQIHWRMAGSTALAMRGIEVAPRDIDLYMDEASAERLNELLADALIEPLQFPRGWVGNCFGRAFLEGRFEWVGKEAAEYAAIPASELEVIEWLGIEVTVPALEPELQVSIQRGLEERAERIRQYLRRRKS